MSVPQVPGALIDDYDTVLFDLDGVLYAGDTALPGAPQALARLRDMGRALAYITNNAARTPLEVAEKLSKLEMPASPDEIVTSAQAAARLLAARLAPGTSVLVVGGTGLVQAVRHEGLTPVFAASDDPVAVVQGFHPDLGWKQLAEGAYAVARGLPWVATNVDRTLPTDHGLAPGNGTLVETIRIATGRSPEVAGKPERPLFDEACRQAGATNALVVGDRLDTDIAGARNAGLPSLLVLTGVAGVRDVLMAPAEHRPTYVATDLTGLFEPYHAPESVDGIMHCDGWTVRVDGDRVELLGEGGRDEAIRALAAFAWRRAEPAALDFDGIELARQ